MPKSKTAPLILIVVAVIVAAGIALYLSRQGTQAGSPVGGDVASAQGSGHIRGAADAPITLVEYGDYQCPTCGYYHPIIMELLSRYNGKLKLEFHHYPLIANHPNALPAALAAEAAAEQGKFWEMNDLLFERQQEWSPNPNAEVIFLQYALHLGLDSNRFMQAMQSPATRDRITADVTRGNSVVRGTPTFILNGQVIPELSGLQGLADRIDRLLPTLAK